MFDRNKPKNSAGSGRFGSDNANRLNENFRQARKRLSQQLGVVRGRAAQNTSRLRVISPSVVRAANRVTKNQPTLPNVALSLHAPVKSVEMQPAKKPPAIPDLQTFQEQRTLTGRLRPPSDLSTLGFATPGDDAPTVSFYTGRVENFLAERSQDNTDAAEDSPDQEQPDRSAQTSTFDSSGLRNSRLQSYEPARHTSFLEGFDSPEWSGQTVTLAPPQPIKAGLTQSRPRRKLRFISAPRRTSQFVAGILGTILVVLFIMGVLIYLRNFLDRAPNDEFSVAFANLGEGEALAHTPVVKDLSHKLSANYQRFNDIPQADLRFDDSVFGNGGQATTSLNKLNSDVVVWGEYDLPTKTFYLQLNLHPNGPFDIYSRHYMEERLYELDAMPFVMAEPDDWNKPNQFDTLMQAFFHYYQGDYPQSVALLAGLIKDPNLNPANEMYLRFWRGNALYAENNYPAALLDYKRAEDLLRQNIDHPTLEPNPLTLSQIFNNRGAVEELAGDMVHAEADYRESTKQDPAKPLGWLNLARFQQNQLAHQTNPANGASLQSEQESNLTNAINQSQSHPLAGAYFYRSQLYYQQNKLTEAESDAVQAKKLNPDLPLAYNQLGWVYLETYFRNGNQNKLVQSYDEFQSGIDVANHLHDQYRTQWESMSHTPGSEVAAQVAENRATDFEHQLETLNYGIARAMLERGRLQGTDAGNPFERLSRFVQGKKLWLEQARDKFLEIIAKDDKNADAHFYLGQTYFLLGEGDWNTQCDAAKKLNPKNYEYYKTLADYYLSKNQTDLAINEYKQYLTQDSNSYAAYLALADLYYRTGQYAFSAGQAASAVKLAPDDFESQLVAGKAFNQLHDYVQAASSLKKAVALDPDSAEARYELGLALNHTGQTDMAIDELGAAADTANKQTGKYKPDLILSSNARYNRGLILQQRGRNDEALNEFKLATANNNFQNADAWLHLGDLYSQHNLPKEAEAAYTAALKINNSPVLVTALAAFKLGGIQQNKGQFAEAEANFDKALSLQPGMHEALLKKGEVQQQQGKPADAITSLNSYVSSNPNVAEAWRFMGDAQRDKGDYKAAEDAYKKALAAQNIYPEVYLGLSQAYLAQKNYPEALNQISLAIKYKANYAEAYLERGLILRQQNQNDQALGSFQQVVTLDPNNGTAYDNIADIYRLHNPSQLQPAIEYYNKAATLNLKDSYSHYQLGLIYAGKDEVDQAITEMKKATDLRGDWPEAWFNLGKLYEQKARATEAMDALNNALKYKAAFGEVHYEADTHYEIGNVWQTKNSANDALEEYKTAISLAQSHKDDLLPAWYQAGSIYESRADLVHAREAYTHVRDNTTDPNLKRSADDSLRRINGQ